MLSAYFFVKKSADICCNIDGFLYVTYTKHHLKFGKNQADNLVAVFNRFI